MPIFILLSLAISATVQLAEPLPSLMRSTELLTPIGVGLAVLGIVLNLLKKLPPPVSYDLFCSSVLIAWFPFWKPYFTDDSPLFFFFPLYFALLTAFVMFFFGIREQSIDAQSLKQMQVIADKSRLKPWVIMIAILISVALPAHYLLFPLLMTLLILRFALYLCLNRSSFYR